MMRATLITAAALSLFLFPYPFTLALSFAASLAFPPVAFLIGIAADILYFVPGEGWQALPAASLAGAGLSLAAFAARHFLKARILEY